MDLGTAAPLRTCCGPPLRNPDAQSVPNDELVRAWLILEIVRPHARDQRRRRQPLTGLLRKPWGAPLALAIPFLCGVIALKGLTVEIRTFHGEDAGFYHLPTILQFADQLPGVDLERYPAAQTPLFHLLFALWGKLVGFELWRLRLLDVAVSYLTLLVLFRWLRRGFGFDQVPALALTLLFGLSPHFLGVSFTLLTDNLSMLFGVLALERFHRAEREDSLGQFALGCVAMGAAVLTRQSFLWLVAVACWALLRARPSLPRLAEGAGVAAVSLAPMAALAAVWGGLVPESADPASCGLCPTRAGVPETGALRALGFTVALFGLYSAAIYAPVLVRRMRRLQAPPLRVVLPPVILGVALTALSDLVYRPPAYGRGAHLGDEGYLWRFADQFPSVASYSLLFWVLVPLGALALWLLARRAGLFSLPVVYVAAFLASTLLVRLVYQKYVDPFALLGLILLMRPGDLRFRSDYAGLGALALGFLAYAGKFYV